MPKAVTREPVRRTRVISPKHFARARKWFGVSGGIKVNGFDRIPLEMVGFEAGRVSIGLPRKRISANLGFRGDPVFCFQESTGKRRVVLVMKSAPPIDKPTGQVIFFAYSIPRSGNGHRAVPLAYSLFDYNLAQNLVSGSELAWTQGSRFVRDRTESETRLAPRWIAGKGFGRFMANLALVEAARRGLRHDIASIRKNPYSERLAVDRAFSRASRRELERYVKSRHPTLTGADFEKKVDEYDSNFELQARKIPRVGKNRK